LALDQRRLGEFLGCFWKRKLTDIITAYFNAGILNSWQDFSFSSKEIIPCSDIWNILLVSSLFSLDVFLIWQFEISFPVLLKLGMFVLFAFQNLLFWDRMLDQSTYSVRDIVGRSATKLEMSFPYFSLQINWMGISLLVSRRSMSDLWHCLLLHWNVVNFLSLSRKSNSQLEMRLQSFGVILLIRSNLLRIFLPLRNLNFFIFLRSWVLPAWLGCLIDIVGRYLISAQQQIWLSQLKTILKTFSFGLSSSR
jgi:hypothetical protein